MSAAQPGPHDRRSRIPTGDQPGPVRTPQRIADILADRVVPLRLAPAPLRRAPRVPFVALVGSVLLAGIVGLLLVNTSMQQNSFEASALESRAAELEARQQTLQMQIEDLRDPQRVARAARDLGMVAAGNPAFLVMSDGSVLGDPQVAEAVDGLRIEPKRAAVPDALRPERVVVVDRSLLERAASRRERREAGTTGADADEGSRPLEQSSEGQDADE